VAKHSSDYYVMENTSINQSAHVGLFKKKFIKTNLGKIICVERRSTKLAQHHAIKTGLVLTALNLSVQ